MDIPLRQNQEEHLRLLCKEMGRSPEDFAKDAILTFMEDYEDRQAAAEAVRESNGVYYTQDQMEQRFGLADPLHNESRKTA